MPPVPIADVLRIGAFEKTFAAELSARYSIPALPNGSARAAYLAEHGPAVRVALTSGPPDIDAELIAALPNLRAIVNNGAGVDAIDVAAAARRGIVVSNTPDVLTDTVADTALGLILMTLRRFGAADRYVRAGRWVVEGPFSYAADLSGAAVGILGLGRIAAAIATRLTGFGCRIGYHNRSPVPGARYDYAASPRGLAVCSDVLVVATSATAATRTAMARLAIRNFESFRATGELLTSVPPPR